LRHAYLEVGVPGDVPSTNKFRDRVFAKINLQDADFSTENFPPGTSGEARLYKILRDEERL
jgi:hypothetical protein